VPHYASLLAKVGTNDVDHVTASVFVVHRIALIPYIPLHVIRERANAHEFVQSLRQMPSATGIVFLYEL
jgi:hypothetical protein